MARVQRGGQLHRRGCAAAPLRGGEGGATDRLELTAGPEDEGARLDAFLAAHTQLGSRAAAQRLIDAGRVSVDGERRPKSHRLAEGEAVSVRPAAQPRGAAEPVEFGVVLEDEHLLVVDKPAGLVTHPAPGHARTTLAEALRGRAAGGPAPDRAGIVHRLDRDTSGLLVVAKTEEAHAALVGMLARREIERGYLALVNGHPDSASGTIDAPLGRDRGRRDVVSTRTARGRRAVTHFEVRERLPRTTLLDVRLETGRTHQIRAHLAAIGHAVCGDPRYGGSACGRRLGLERQFLHAASLMFRHPMTGEMVRCESKPPAELRRALDKARQEPVPGGPDGN
ncbi:MAG TPA: RluA family pseudouridine synthase [Thermoleophilaceae bacterium]|nr:RluA family pseudouridine synthase [Thermoleophilaceae bacterium]